MEQFGVFCWLHTCLNGSDPSSPSASLLLFNIPHIEPKGALTLTLQSWMLAPNVLTRVIIQVA